MNTNVEKSPKKRAEQGRAQETKTKILSAALAEFALSGFDGASVRIIAKRAELNHALISHHFGDKDALWKATAEWIFNRYSERVQARQEALKAVEQKAMIRALLRDFVEFCAEVPDFHRFMMHANQQDSERLHWLVDTFLRPDAAKELNLFQQAKKHGLMPEGDSLHLRYLFIGAASSIFTFAPEFQRLAEKDPFSQAIIEQHVDYILKLFEV